MTTAVGTRRLNLQRLLSPRHVAFFGGQGVVEPIRQCLANGFTGAIWPVNPKYRELGGLACHCSLDDLPEAPDASFIAVPREATIEVVRALAARGAGGAVCYAAGFAEVGEEGAALQRALVEAAGELALVGPNCYGILNYVDGVVLFASGPAGRRVERGVALVAQSGNLALNATFNQRSVPFAYVISAGNQAVLDMAQYVDALAEDSRVSAIALYIEGLTDIPAFARATLKALQRGVPIVALKVGNSELGAKLALSHTSSMAGDDKLYTALFERLGVIRAGTLPALLETAKLLAVCGHPKGERLAVFTCSGGDGLLAADAAAAIGLTLPELSAEQVAELRPQLPHFASISNPLDYNTQLWGDGSSLTRCFSTVLAGDFDAGMLVIDYPPSDPLGAAACGVSVRALREAGLKHDKHVLVASTLSEALPEAAREEMVSMGVAPMQGLEDALAAFAAAARQARRHDRLRADRSSGHLPPALPPLASGRRLMGEWESKRLLADYGLTVPEGCLVAPEEAPAAAAALGFPVVAKVAEPALAHKTESGAVALDLRSEAEVAAAVEAMAEALAARQPGARIERLIVERQVRGAVGELIVGARRDPQFGLALLVGSGGVLVELVADAVALLLPASRPQIVRALSSLKASRLLAGYRGRVAGDFEAAADAVEAIAAFAEANRERLAELDVNPLLVMAKGRGAVAVDALVVFAEP